MATRKRRATGDEDVEEQTQPTDEVPHSDQDGNIVRPEGSEPPDLADFNDGKGYFLKEGGEEFGLKEMPDDPHGHTHHLKNIHHFWAGNKAQFEAQFSTEKPK